MGHVSCRPCEILAARQLGDYLLVGIDNDAKVNRHRGFVFRVNIQERTLSVCNANTLMTSSSIHHGVFLKILSLH